MKKIQIQTTLCILSLLILFVGCKKDALTIESEKLYIQEIAVPATNPFAGPMSLSLKPGEIGDFSPGGDIMYRVTYNISGKNITFKVADLNRKYKFTIISEKELRAENGEILLLKED